MLLLKYFVYKFTLTRDAAYSKFILYHCSSKFTFNERNNVLSTVELSHHNIHLTIDSLDQVWINFMEDTTVNCETNSKVAFNYRIKLIAMSASSRHLFYITQRIDEIAIIIAKIYFIHCRGLTSMNYFIHRLIIDLRAKYGCN